MLAIQHGVVYKILHQKDREIPHDKNLLTGFPYGQDTVHWQIYCLATSYATRELDTAGQICTGTTVMKTNNKMTHL